MTILKSCVLVGLGIAGLCILGRRQGLGLRKGAGAFSEYFELQPPPPPAPPKAPPPLTGLTLAVKDIAAGRSSVEQFGTADNWGTSAEQERLLKWVEILPLSKTLKKVVPFIAFEVPIILKGWLCCCVSVGCLYMFIPQIGMLSKHLSQGDLPKMGWRTALVVSLVGTRSMALFWQQTLLWETALNVTFKVRSYVFEKVLKREMAFFEGQQAVAAGDLAFRITTDAEDLGDTVYCLLHTMVPSALQLIAMSTRMITLNRLLSAATFLVFPCMAVVIALLGERLRELARKSQDSIAKLSSYLTEVLPSMFVVKAHAAEVSEQFRFQTLAWTERRTHLDKKKMKACIPEMITLVYVLTALVLLSLGTWAISIGTFDGAGMVSFITSLVLLVEPVQAIGRAYNEIKLGEPAIERLFEVTTSRPMVLEKCGALPLQTATGEVELRSVSFRYNAYSPWVLDNVSLFVRPGETVALVGASGGGKTTLAKLLLRLYDPVHGTIFIDGKDIRDLSFKSLRKHVVIVPQETTLFTGTVEENIAYGKLPCEVNIQAVMRAAQLANADEFIQKLKHGYSTNLGDRASSLSGGQKQRLAIARAIYQEATVLILDEATSALDNESEKLVQAALERLMFQKTVFVIAHRLETVKRADRILVLDEGRIVEEGTHLSLLGSGGKYAALNMTLMPEDQATPAVCHLSKSYDVNLEDVPGSGKDGHVLKKDLLKCVSSKEELGEEIRAIEPARGTAGTLFQSDSFDSMELEDRDSKENVGLEAGVSVAVKPVVEDLSGSDKIIPVRGFRQTMAKTMTAAVSVPHFHYTEDINVDALVQLRDSLKNVPLEQGVKLTYLPFLLKALSIALTKYPLMNSTVNQDVSEITVRASHNIGVGMATSVGLVVPNIKNVQDLSVLEIAEELTRLTQLAATNRLGNEELTGGTITVSNFGSIGGKYGSPVLSVPEVATVAIGRIQRLPRYSVDGSVYPANIMGVTWGVDQRVLNGATVASFCNQWKVIIEQPERLTLNMR